MTKLLSPRQIAARLSIHRRDVYRLIKDWPQVKLSERRIRIEETTLEAYIESKRIGIPWDVSTNAPKAARTGRTTRTRRPANDTSEVSEPETDESPTNDSDKPNWLRPLKRAGAAKS